jgi:hypothetical protein
MSLKNPFDKIIPKPIKTGVWASIVLAVLLISIGIFWVAHSAAAEGSFSIVPRFYWWHHLSGSIDQLPTHSLYHIWHFDRIDTHGAHALDAY